MLCGRNVAGCGGHTHPSYAVQHMIPELAGGGGSDFACVLRGPGEERLGRRRGQSCPDLELCATAPPVMTILHHKCNSGKLNHHAWVMSNRTEQSLDSKSELVRVLSTCGGIPC